MSMLLFMPWCRIDKTYEVGDGTILRFERQKPIAGLSQEGQIQVNTIMGARILGENL